MLAANISDREGGKILLTGLKERHPQLALHFFVDGGYRGPWEEWVKTNLKHTVEVVQRADANVRGYWLPEGQELSEEQLKTFKGRREFAVIPKRWVVERSFAWISFDRRLNREYDLLPEVTEAFIQLTFIRIMIRRLAEFEREKQLESAA